MDFLASHLPQLQLLAMAVNIVLVLVIVPLRASINRLEESDDKLADRIQRLELKLAENYVQRPEVYDQFAEISRKLERIEAALVARIAHMENRG